MVFTQPCDVCGGEGRAVSEPCRSCRGTGLVPKTEVVAVPIPAGIESGTRVAIPGRGHAGALGGPAGDLYVTVEVADHPYLRREGRDLHVTVPIAVHEAALGGVIDVPALGGLHRVRIPAGSSSGQQVRVPGEGVGAARAGDATSPETGDLVVTLQIVLPARLDERSKALLREFGRLNAGDVRRDWLPLAEPARAGGQVAE
jgi:molecular chaperone DnaJ